jgi:hypothetical protein
MIMNDPLRVRLVAPAIVGACLLLAGCRGPAVMRSSFRDYSEAYASLSNEQMLLNLARRAHRHPAYFLQLGPINSTFVFNKSATANMGWSSPAPGPGPLGDAWNAGSGLAFSATEQPTFAMTPLGGESFAAALFNPLSSVVFFNLFEQGVPVDKLLRCMVQKVEFTWPDGATFVLSNIIDRERPESYINFLRFAGLARELQKQQILIVTNSLVMPGTAGSRQSTFAFKAGSEGAVRKIVDEHSYFQFDTQMTERPKTAAVAFQLSTFEAVLVALATEQRLFQDLSRSHPNFLNSIPPSERQPILRLDWTGATGKRTAPLVGVKYLTKSYEIADEIVNGTEETWNRDVFVLLTHVFTQISLDPNKLPVQQLIQVR